MATHYTSYTFKGGEWETIDTYWNSPFSYWAQKGMRVEPPVPLRVLVFGRVTAESDAGFINYGGTSAILVQTVQAKGHAGQQIRIEIDDEPVIEQED